mmetsp:Transcript_23084/g.64008  ORF Transcript_23084/g.64008 Transcript_23084/m.64008 type:complete len:372 (+) Transcript_23084:336-1451(+)|eukprot:CAMPEP_0172368088 /NCGR_PEP_ID=MMETSP1060-20121228/25024_1 /TAXON_ID=37318 /ORGANISM="Pseudo-nitzschia pungens, Strain cf. cingulata" /LENGTH=371 /DNA_ID=CAMNT_0013092551 /DNA_START=141 /DNA_END=1256 /DNA_ORIENTATION=+
MQAPESSSPSSPIKVPIPEPDKVVTYATSSSEPNRGALKLFGDPASPRIALMCPGFPDDHQLFQPFARALSATGVLVGVMCLPGFDHRPEDGVLWNEHKADGYSFGEMICSVREAAGALRRESEAAHSSAGNAAEFTAIFHDWGVVPGTVWASQIENEPETQGPDRIVFFDVLAPPPKEKAAELVEADGSKAIIRSLSPKEMVVTVLYKLVFAFCFELQRCLSKYLALLIFIPSYIFLEIFRLSPILPEDEASRKALDIAGANLSRVLYTGYPYSYLVGEIVRGTVGMQLHKDWKKTPILYMYGPEKRTQFHSFATLELLRREKAGGRSLSRVVSMEGGGHYFFLQQPETSLKHLLDFMEAENTFAEPPTN